MSQLVAVEGPLAGKTFNLQAITVLGRSFDADIHIDDLTVSRHHAKIEETPQGYLIEDMGSGNGTQVNDQDVTNATPLANGDTIRLSENIFRFDAKAGASQPDADLSMVSMTDDKAEAIVEKLDVKATLMGLTADKLAVDPAALKKAHERLSTVVAISNAVQTQLDLDKLLTEIMDSLFRVFTQADRGFIMLKDSEADDLVPRAAKERGKEEPGEITISRSVIDDIVQNRVAVLTADAMGDERFANAASIMNFQIRSMMCAPLIANDDFLGVIHIDTVHQDKRFTKDDLELLTGVANQTAFAIANAKLHVQLMKRERMQRDMALARQVQESFLPGEPPEVQGIELTATYKAALEVGGDFYDYIPLPDGRIAIGLGDVAGKGVPAALTMARMSSDMRLFASHQEPAGTVLTKLNTQLILTGIESAFVTVVLGILDPKTCILTLANAAHCLPVLRRGKTGEVSEIDVAGGFPLGAVDDHEYEQGTFQMEPGDVICFFSDGIPEAMNANKDFYGVERLLEVVAKPAASAREVQENILGDVHAFVGDTPASDDLTLVCIGAKDT